MIKINDKEYKTYNTKISWEKFISYKYNQKRTGIAPRILFYVDNINIEIELSFSKDMFEEMEIGNKSNIKEYITDISFTDGKGWITLMDGKYDFNITKINNKNFLIDFYVNYNYLEEDDYNIIITEEIEIL